MSLQTEIEKYTGALGTYSNKALATIKAEVKHIVQAVSRTNPDNLYLFSKNDTGFTGATLSMESTDKLLDVRAGDISAVKIPPSLAKKAGESSSIYYATEESPVYYIRNNVITVVGGTGTYEADLVSYDDTFTLASGTIDSFPDDWMELPVLAAAKNVIQNKLTAIDTPTGYNVTESLPSSLTIIGVTATIPSWSNVTGIDLSGVTALNDPTATTIGYTGATATLMSTASVGNYITGPTFTSQSAFSAPTTGTISELDLSALTSPTAPTVGNATFAGATYLAVSGTTLAAQASGPASYSNPTFSAPTFSMNAITFAGIDVPSVGLTAASYSDATAVGQTGSTVTFNATAPTYTEASISWTGTGGAETTLDLKQFEKWLEDDEDPELAQVQLGKAGSILNKYSSEMQNNLNKFNEENTEYAAALQVAIQNAQMAAQEYAAEAQTATSTDIANKAKAMEKEAMREANKLQKYQTDVGLYQQEVNVKVQEWQSNEFQPKFQKWMTEYQNKLQAYQLEITDALNEFNAKNVEFQADLQIRVQNAQYAAQKATQDSQTASNVLLQNELQETSTSLQNHANQLQKYSGEIGEWQQEVTKSVTEWTTNNINYKLQKYFQDYTNLLQLRGLDIQENLNDFNAENVEFQADVQKKITDAQMLQQKYTQDAQLATTIDQQNKSQEMAARVQDEQNKLQVFALETQNYNAQINEAVSQFQSDLSNEQAKIGAEFQEYQMDLARVQQTNQDNLAEFNSLLSKYNADVQSESARFQTDLAKYNTDYQWLQDQYRMVSEQYVQMFNTFIGGGQSNES